MNLPVTALKTSLSAALLLTAMCSAPRATWLSLSISTPANMPAAQTSSSASASSAALPSSPSAAISKTPLSAGVISTTSPLRSVSLSQCFSSAERYNRELLSGRWNVAIAKAGVKSASAIPNPQFSIQAGFGNSFEYIFDGQTQQYFLTEDLQTAGKRGKKIDLARANAALSEIQLEALKFDVHNRVRRAYAELAAAEAYEALIESQRAVGMKILNIAQKRYEAGRLLNQKSCKLT